MESLLILIVLVLIGVIFIFPVIILSKISSLKNDVRMINFKVDELLKSKSQQIAPKEKVEVQEMKEVEYDQLPEETYRQEEDTEVEEKAEVYPAIEYQETAVAEPSIPTVEIQQSLTQDKAPVLSETEEIIKRNIFGKLLGTNWLSKIGIVTLVLGIGFFVKYAIDQEWINEIGRVGIGLLTGGIIIGIAHKLNDKYNVFSSILVGGGISVFYITITIAFREYELFSQTLAFVLLIVTTIFSVILSLLYDRKELAIFSLLGGFASPLMISTGVGSYIVLFSYILILNTGMLIVSFIKKWRIIGIISYVLTLAFFWTWTLRSYENQFLNVSLFISLFFIQFYLLALLDHFNSEKKITAHQVFYILTNNLSAFLAYIFIFNKYAHDIRGLITILFAVVNAVVLVSLFRNSRINRNLIYLIIAIVLSFVSLAIPVQLKGHVITLFWAAETVILLWLWQKSRISIFYYGFILISILVLLSYLMDTTNLNPNNFEIPSLTSGLFVTGIVVIAAFYINRLLLKREPDEEGYIAPIARIFKFGIIVLAYIVPFIELDFQLVQYANMNDFVPSNFINTALATFTTIYISILGIIYNKLIPQKKFIFGLLFGVVYIYTLFYTSLVTDLRYDIFKISEETHLAGYFSVHLLSLPAFAYIVYLLIKNVKSLKDKMGVLISWALTISVVMVLSIEADNIVVWILGNTNNYYDLLYDVHTFGYPVLWGIIAMAMMIWGLNRKEALLRKISLVFFGLIIVKFYVYDVWKMSQYGRIISFVLLGVILLIVSFLQQKIRTLVKSDDKEETINKKINETNQ
jgi:uncharacterized membrane protein